MGTHTGASPPVRVQPHPAALCKAQRFAISSKSDRCTLEETRPSGHILQRHERAHKPLKILLRLQDVSSAQSCRYTPPTTHQNNYRADTISLPKEGSRESIRLNALVQGTRIQDEREEAKLVIRNEGKKSVVWQMNPSGRLGSNYFATLQMNTSNCLQPHNFQQGRMEY